MVLHGDSKTKAQGGKIVTTAHTFSGVNRAIQAKFNTMYLVILLSLLRAQGMKVVVEITAMAVDAGAIPTGKTL
jgi:hypothetical protein